MYTPTPKLHPMCHLSWDSYPNTLRKYVCFLSGTLWKGWSDRAPSPVFCLSRLKMAFYHSYTPRCTRWWSHSDSLLILWSFSCRSHRWSYHKLKWLQIYLSRYSLILESRDSHNLFYILNTNITLALPNAHWRRCVIVQNPNLYRSWNDSWI